MNVCIKICDYESKNLRMYAMKYVTMRVKMYECVR